MFPDIGHVDDRRSDLSCISSCSTPPAPFRCSYRRPASRARRRRSKTIAVTLVVARSSSGVEMLARGIRPSGAISTLIVSGGPGVGTAVTCEKTLAFVRGQEKARRSCRQRLLRRLHPGRSRHSRRPPRHHALAAHPAFSLKTYPKVKLEPDRIFVCDGNIWKFRWNRHPCRDR